MSRDTTAQVTTPDHALREPTGPERTARPSARRVPRGRRAATLHTTLSSPMASVFAIVVGLLWTVPTFGLLVSSFRHERDVKNNGWWTLVEHPGFTLDNYREVLFGDAQLGQYFLNSFLITIPAVLIPLAIASLAAYAFAWMRWRGRDVVFIVVFALQVVPIQVALVPLLRFYSTGEYLGLQLWSQEGIPGFWPVWISHSIFALPMAIFILHNFMRDIPSELLEAARVDGADHVQTFFRMILPLSRSALAAFGIFQFLWVWNDLLVALVMVGGTPDVAPLTVRVAELSGSEGSEWHLLTAGAFVSMVVPMIVFLTMQKHFVRGLLAGGLKG